MTVKEHTYSRVCPFCNRIHTVENLYMNTRCECGGKYYSNTGDWVNRKTGKKVKGLNNKCGCERCDLHKINKKETGHNCISFGLTRRILLNVLDCEEKLSPAQKEAFNIVIETISELDKEYDHG